MFSKLLPLNISKFIKNNTLAVKVIPSAGRTELKEENARLKLYLKSAPEKDKANMELIKFFKKNYHFSVRVKSGATARKKVLEIIA
mgnify:CR=1 FL=1